MVQARRVGRIMRTHHMVAARTPAGLPALQAGLPAPQGWAEQSSGGGDPFQEVG